MSLHHTSTIMIVTAKVKKKTLTDNYFQFYELSHWINQNVGNNNWQLGGLLCFLTAFSSRALTVFASGKNTQATKSDRLAVFFLSPCVCVMISLAHPGSVLIDLLNAEIDCREAEQPYWSAAFIIHSVWGARGEAGAGGEAPDWMT